VNHDYLFLKIYVKFIVLFQIQFVIVLTLTNKLNDFRES